VSSEERVGHPAHGGPGPGRSHRPVLDGKAAALLCARTLTSLVLLENLARWPATPPAVIGHLLKQPMVLRMPQLRTLLKRHPNCPGSAK
jgi:hypothetical protein